MPMELEKLDIDWLVYCYEAKSMMQWVEEDIIKDACRLNSTSTSTTNTQIESSYTKPVFLSNGRKLTP